LLQDVEMVEFGNDDLVRNDADDADDDDESKEDIDEHDPAGRHQEETQYRKAPASDAYRVSRVCLENESSGPIPPLTSVANPRSVPIWNTFPSRNPKSSTAHSTTPSGTSIAREDPAIPDRPGYGDVVAETPKPIGRLYAPSKVQPPWTWSLGQSPRTLEYKHNPNTNSLPACHIP
jgi:hypothetical protein